MEKKEKNFEDLTFIRITDPNIFALIPRHLFEQIPEREWEVDNLYTLGPLFLTSPLNWLYALTDIENVIKGILWTTIDPVVQILSVNILSVDSEYQRPLGNALKQTRDFLREEIKKTKLKKKILWATTRPNAFKRIGAKESKRKIMEI